MASIYNFWSSAYNEIKNTQRRNRFFVPILLLLSTIALPLGVNNVVLIGCLLYTIFHYKELKLSKSIALLVPILLFLWMTLSYFWSIDTQQTLKAIPKESSLLLIPTLFCFIPTITTEIKQKIIKYYSYSIVLFVLFFIARAVVKYLITGDSRAFFLSRRI